MRHEQRLASGMSAGVGVFTTDASLVVQTWDDWLARATGIGADAARGRPLTELVPDLDARGLLAPFERVLTSGTVEILAPAFHRYLIPCPPAGSSRVFDRMQQRVTVGPLREQGRVVGAVVAVEDVTARLERERALAAELSSLDPGVRLEAARRLADAEPIDGKDPLLAAIGDEHWQVRRATVQGLFRRKTAETIGAVIRALREHHRDFAVLSSAIELLAAGDEDVIEPLVELLRSPDADLRLQAALVLGERGDPRANAPLVDALSDPDENVRFHAIEALGKLKAGAAADELAALAESGGFFLAFPALEALAQIGDPMVAPRLTPLLKDPLLRSAVAETLGRIGDHEVVEPLTRLLDEATVPTGVVAGALSAVFDRYEERYQGGEHVAHLVRQAISPAGTQNLLDAVQRATTDHLRPIAMVLGWLEGAAVDRALTRLLGEPSVRGTVVEYLVRHGERVVDLLVEQLDAEDLDIRRAAVVGLGRIGDTRATGPLLRVLADVPELAVATAGALARMGDPRAFEDLLGRIGHPDAAVRQAVIAALNSIGHPDMARRVCPRLRDPDPHARESAVRIAGYFGYDACANDLLACCHDPEPAVRRAAIEHLAFLDDERVVPALLDALAGENAAMRASAAQTLGRLDDPRVRAPLVTALSDPDAWVRYYAAGALGEHRHAAAIDDLVRLAFDDPAGHVRLAAIGALGRIGSPAALPALGVLSDSDDAERAIGAIRAIGEIGDSEAWKPLEAALRAPDIDRRVAAAEAIARLDGRAAIDLLEWIAAADESDAVTGAAVRTISALAADRALARAAVEALISLTADAARRPVAIAALSGLPDTAVDEVARGLRDRRPAVRAAVLQALGRMRRPDASRWIESGLDDEVPEVRIAALTELRLLGTRRGGRRVVTLAKGDPDAAVRRAALAVLDGSLDAAVAGDTGTGRNAGGGP